MTKRTLSNGSICLIAMLLAVRVSPADDFAPPPWRNDPNGGTTVQEWEFRFSDSVRDATNPLPPDGDTVTQRWGPGAGGRPPGAWESEVWGWIDEGNGDGMIMPLADNQSLFLHIPNTLDDLPAKFLRIQIKYSDRNVPPTGAKPSVNRVESAPLPGTMGQRLGVPHDPAVGQHWEDWALNPNPHREYVAIDVPKYVAIDQLIVDTICTVPEPMSVILLAGSAGMLFLRRTHRAFRKA
jgi:hypothetical protein